MKRHIRRENDGSLCWYIGRNNGLYMWCPTHISVVCSKTPCSRMIDVMPDVEDAAVKYVERHLGGKTVKDFYDGVLTGWALYVILSPIACQIGSENRFIYEDRDTGISGSFWVECDEVNAIIEIRKRIEEVEHAQA